ncbi:MAG: S8 family serine peptidase [Gemmatimonadetes bacterium]|nr:S8 family serine peptidase [Gemmatimonadota bacterium]
MNGSTGTAMGRHSVAVLLSLLLFSGSALPAAAQSERLDPAIRALLEPQVLDAVRRNTRIGALIVAGDEPVQGALAVRRGAAGSEPVLGVFLRIRDAGVLDALRAAGAEIGAIVDDIVSARIPLDALERLGTLAGIERVEAARALRIEHDSSLKAIHVEEVRQLVDGEWQGATGRGAIVAIYDTGLDLQHEDFIDDAGSTRVLGLWDQVSSGTPPQGFTRGHYCSPDAIQQVIDTNGAAGCPQRDFHGHGTHVAGSAAGDGAGATAPDPHRYAGVAPDASLLIVNGGPGIFFEDLIIDGLTWLRTEALRLSRPAVANLSLGGQFGPHDGSRLYERMIDAISGPGFVVVIAAGNNGVNGNTTPPLTGRLIHARGVPTGTQAVEVDIDIPAYTPNSDACTGNFVHVSLWYEAADQLRIEVERPAGTRASAGRGELVTQTDANGRIRIDNGASGPNPENGDIEAAIALDGCGGSGVPQTGLWKLRVTPAQPGSGQPWDLWITSTAGPQPVGRTGFDNRFVIGSPGNARRAITVGAFVSRLCWPSQATAGQICYTQREEPGDLARFSSAGPTRDGRVKPEITAPGLGVMSALSRSTTTSAQRTAPDGVHSVREGTSMSTPHVTGAVAVLMQANPQLTPEDAIAAITATATADAFTIRTYDSAPGGTGADWWGAGKLNVRDALVGLSDGPPSTLSLEAVPAVPGADFLGRRGERLSLLRLDFQASGLESIDVLAIGFDVDGEDPGARLLLVRDANSDGVDTSDPIVGSVAAPLAGAQQRLVIEPDALRVSPFGAGRVFAVIEMSGRAPNGASFTARLVPETIRSIGVRSGARDRIEPGIVAVASGPVEATVLQPGELLAFSANPVRSDEVVLNFAEAPTLAAVYTVSGRRVIDLCRRVERGCGTPGDRGTSLVWDLTGEEGDKVAPGVYLVVFRVGSQTFREKLMVLRPGAVPDESESR